MSDSYRSELILVNRAVGVAETRAQIDTITKSVAQLAREDALYTQKQATYARQREAASRREAAARQSAEIAAMRSVERQERELRNYQIQWAREVAREKAAAAQQAAREQAAAAKQAAQQARAVEAASRKAEGQAPGGFGLSGDIKNFAAGLYTVQAAYRALAGAASLAMSAINEAAMWQKYEVAITTMEGSAKVAAQSLKDLYDIAKAPGIDLAGANKSYLQLRSIGIEGERSKRIISEFANTVARSGGSGVEFERVNRQLVQMLANGRVLESELKWMKESMPEMAKVMQATFGTTSAEGIRNLGISADEFVRRLTDAFAQLPRAEATLSTSLENMSTAWSKFKASIVPMGTTSFIAEGVTSELEAMAAIIEGLKSPIETTRKMIEEIKAIKDKTEGLSNNTLRQVNALGTSDATRRFLLYGEGTSSAQGMASRAAFEKSQAIPGPSEAEIKAAQQIAEEYAKTSEPAAMAKEKAWYEERVRLFKNNATALEQLNAVHAMHIKQIKEQFKLEEEKQPEAVNVDYWTATGQKTDEIQYYWNRSRGGTGAQNAAMVQERKKALEEIAVVNRGAKEQELVEAAAWRAKMLSVIGDDNAAYLRLEEAYGKKLADINDKYNKQIVEDEKKRQQERLAAMESFTSGMGSLAGAMGGLILQMNDQNTEAYAAMVAIQQGFAIAQATMNMWVAMSNALTLPFPANIAAVGQVAAAGGQIVSAITAMNVAKVGKGFFDNGGTLGYGEWGIAGERGPEIIEGPARITSRRETAAMMRGSGTATGTVVNVHNYAGASVATKTNTDGSIDLIIDRLEDRLAEGIYSGSGKVAPAMARSFGLRRQGR